MAKFVIECPRCGTFHKVSTSIFAKRNVECDCGYTINIKEERCVTRVCPHCKNTVVYDQAKSTSAICPVCKGQLVTEESMKHVSQIMCPSCSCELTVDKNATTYECPLCETKIDVQQQLKKQQIRKEGVISVIKYEGPNDVFVWKHPIEDFNLGSQLIVHESQEALFFKDGKALDLFGAGRYTLATNNIPLLKDLYKIPGNVEAVFHSEVYFVNLVTHMGIKWGTDSKVRMFDPLSGMHLEIGACGNFNLQVVDSRKFVVKLVGTTAGLNQNDLIDTVDVVSTDGGKYFTTSVLIGKFKSLIISKVKSFLAKTIRENDINILEVDEHIDLISQVLKSKINEVLKDYGLHMPEFFITTVLTPDDDPNFRRMKEQYAERYLKVQQERILIAEAEVAQQRKLIEAQTMAQEEIIAAQAQAEAYRLQAQAEAQEMQMKGYTYQQETQRQVATAAVQNMPNGGGIGGGTGDGGMTGMLGGMVNLGVGLGVMGEVVGQVKNAVNPMINAGQQIAGSMSASGWNCSCGQANIQTPFCPVCGNKKVEPNAQTGWTCTCGQTNIQTPFCPNCGSKKKEEPSGWTCTCGQENIKTPFCPSCGSKKVEEPVGWTCECGQTNIQTPFCPACGSKKKEEPVGWTCECGQENIQTPFCPACGKKKEEEVNEE